MLPLEGGGVTLRIPAEAGPRRVQLMSAVNRHVKEPTDLEKENKKQRQRRGLEQGKARAVHHQAWAVAPPPQGGPTLLLPLFWPV